MDKLGPGRIAEERHRRYPDRYNLPSEIEIRGEIARLLTSSKKRKAETSSKHDTAQQNRPFPDTYTEFLRPLMKENQHIKPLRALELLRGRFSDSICSVDDAHVRANVSALKRTLSLQRGEMSK